MAMKNHSRKVAAGTQEQWISDFLNGDSRFFGAGRADSIKQLVKDDVLYDRISVYCPEIISEHGRMDIEMPHDKLVYEPLDKDHVAIRCIDDSDIMVSYYEHYKAYSHPGGMVEAQLDQNTVRRLVSTGLQEKPMQEKPMQDERIRNRIEARKLQLAERRSQQTENIQMKLQLAEKLQMKLQQAKMPQQVDRGATVDADLGLLSEPSQVEVDYGDMRG